MRCALVVGFAGALAHLLAGCFCGFLPRAPGGDAGDANDLGGEVPDAGEIAEAESGCTTVTCDDGDPCTHDDRCQEDGTCRGVAYTCTPGACQRSICDGAGGCNVSAVTPCCGNSTCESGEDCSSCPGDCGSCCPATTCGDGACYGCAGEDCRTCCRDCGGCGCGDGRCLGPETCATCASDCLCPTCGNGVCDAGENSCNCWSDCGGTCSLC